MITAEDIKMLIKEGEGLHLEVKACKDKLPKDVWETYSAFANTRGGVILLGVTEHKDKPFDQRFEFTGVSDSYKVITDFFNIVNNKQKVNRSVLVDSDVRPVEVDGVTIVHIKVPEADYRQKPIYINNNLQSGTFKRMHEGDRHVTDEELAMLIRDSSDNADGQILNRYGFEHVDLDTLLGYRNAFNGHNPGHFYEKLSDLEFLKNLGGYSSNPSQQTEGLTVAGLLMFGKSVTIHQVFPNFRFDYLNLIGVAPGESKKCHEESEVNEVWLTLPLSKTQLAKDENKVENSTVNGNRVENSTVNGNRVENSTVNSTVNGNRVENSTVNSTVNGNRVENSTANLTEIQKGILKLIHEKPEITIEEIAGRIDKDRNAVNYQLKKLKEAGIVERDGSDKTGKWKII